MSVTIANTDAQLSGKTLLTADANQTITGLKTYDRGVSAPLAIVSGAAKVSNLDADKLDGEEGTDFHDAALLTGTIAAISGVNLTNLNASNLASGTAPTARGGTGLSSYAVGDLLFASATTTLAKLADVATGSVLVSGGITTAPAYSASPSLTSLTLSTALAVSSGGSGRLTATTAYAVIAAGTTATGAQQSIAPSTSGFVLTDNGVGVLPSFQAASGAAVNDQDNILANQVFS